MQYKEIGQYLVIDPEICHGQLTFKGTRIPVDTVLTYLAMGYSLDVIVHGWPQLSRPAVKEAILMALDALLKDYDYPGKLPEHDPDEFRLALAS